MKEMIKSEKAPRAIGPYSQGVKVNGMLFLSGQLPICPNKGKITETTIEGQLEQALENVKAILQSEGCEMKDIVKTTVFLKNLDDFEKMNIIYAKYFCEGEYPARSAYQVGALPQNALVEIEVIAEKKE